AQGGDAGAAIRAGATWLIAGRSIAGARSPRGAAQGLVETIRRARGNRGDG
ncbi:MAG: orotidine-5'-phosphate decarboxylase, partial [Euryarchaeota archaeon]|nr:orotidine-5'-phosphate decarboxylase [Euryarchaeota archaeon]